jgi:hypothetical protein
MSARSVILDFNTRALLDGYYIMGRRWACDWNMIGDEGDQVGP